MGEERTLEKIKTYCDDNSLCCAAHTHKSLWFYAFTLPSTSWPAMLAWFQILTILRNVTMFRNKCTFGTECSSENSLCSNFTLENIQFPRFDALLPLFSVLWLQRVCKSAWCNKRNGGCRKQQKHSSCLRCGLQFSAAPQALFPVSAYLATKIEKTS